MRLPTCSSDMPGSRTVHPDGQQSFVLDARKLLVADAPFGIGASGVLTLACVDTSEVTPFANRVFGFAKDLGRLGCRRAYSH
jgi:hypothetical protein